MPPGLRLDAPRFTRAVRALRRADPDIDRLVRRVGPPALIARRPRFPTLVRIILEQQVSIQSAATSWRRLSKHVGPMSPRRLARLDDVAMREAGMSGPRIARLRALATGVLSGDLDIASLSRAPDDAVRNSLMRIPGIGAWTADIYLIFALLRPDVWPIGDLALARAVQRLRRMRRQPAPGKILSIAGEWAPWRTVAAHILWHGYLADAGRLPPR